jgi:flagella basal body P-ring formation protein FlgA
MLEHSPSFLPAASFAGAVLMCGSLAAAASMEVPVPNITIYPGDLISQNLLVDRAFTIPPGESWPVHKNREELVGKVARRTLLPGKPIPLNAIREADVISQGKPVTIVFQAADSPLRARRCLCNRAASASSSACAMSIAAR